MDLNMKLKDFVGDYYHINNTHEVAPAMTSSKTKNEKDKMIVLNDKNTFFADIEVVQRTMVALYGITEEGMWWSSWITPLTYSMFYVKFGNSDSDLGDSSLCLQRLVMIRSSLCSNLMRQRFCMEKI